MGFGGFNMHPRTGLATEYLGPDFFNAIRACVKKARQLKMHAWLYDEDRWPSGYAGGLVTRDQQHRIKHLLWTTTPYSIPPKAPSKPNYTGAARSENGILLSRYEVRLRNGYLHHYRRLKDGRKTSQNTQMWYAYLESSLPRAWFNEQTYVDTFSRRAIERFIEVTHERYADVLKHDLGSVVPAIFTDEPQFVKKSHFGHADETKDLFMPFTGDFPQTYQKAYGQDLLDHLPELFWNLPDNTPSVVRYRYHDHTAERFASAFSDTLGQWCQAHNIALAGHLLGEGSLASQTRGVGEAMRALRSFQLPGIDILQDKMELLTAKQAQSVARQLNRPGVLSELYGVTNWDFDFVGHKAQGDWQAACGVTVRVPHLAWLSMAAESKRDYPASIGYQSPWYKEYPLIENHFARVNAVMTRGKPVVRAAVIHPIESFWLAWGPSEHNADEQQQFESAVQEITRWLSFGLIDFDFLSEAMQVQLTKYDVIIVPALRTIRSTTLMNLTRFARNGGKVIFAGRIPDLVDAKPSSSVRKLARQTRSVDWNRIEILNALESFREIQINRGDGSAADSFLYQLREERSDRYLFICNTDRQQPCNSATIRVAGRWQATWLDTMTGQKRATASWIDDGHTLIPWDFPPHGHALFALSRRKSNHAVRRSVRMNWVETGRLADPVSVTLSEPNVLLFDQAQWKINAGPWQPIEEILRLDNAVRRRFGFEPRTGRSIQPWADAAPAPVLGQVQLRYAIGCDVRVSGAKLALENAKAVRIELDGRRVKSDAMGWWVDEAIETVALPTLSPGQHELVLNYPFTRKTELEACYLLGDFGVIVAGRHAKIVPPVRKLAWGDWTNQGLPFYGGNVTYHCTIKDSGQPTLLKAANFKSPLLSIDVDGQLAGKIAFAPFQLRLGKLDKTRRHKLDITAFGNRVNTFGALHNCTKGLTWFGPPAWRSTGKDFSYEYQIRPMGILTAPLLKIPETNR